jgi:LexA DNA binding domain
MAELAALDRTYHVILEAILDRGYPPHFTELARALGVSPATGRERLHALMATGLPNWLFPGTDLVAGFAPFGLVPNQYRVMVDRHGPWFAQ